MQEVDRFNKLVKVLSSTLSNIKKAIKGLVLMSAALGALYFSFLKNEVPAVWAKASYISMKPLASWFAEFKERVAYIRNWLTGGLP